MFNTRDLHVHEDAVPRRETSAHGAGPFPPPGAGALRPERQASSQKPRRAFASATALRPRRFSRKSLVTRELILTGHGASTFLSVKWGGPCLRAGL